MKNDTVSAPSVPVHRVKVSPVNIAIWKNQNRDDDQTYHTATITRVFKKDGEFMKTNSYNLKQLKLLQIAVDEALAWMEDHEDGNS